MDLGLLLFRLVVGLTLAAHGSQKLFGAFGGGGISGTGAFFEKHLGLRPGKVHASIAGITEFAAGIALALGLLTPIPAAAIVGTMVVAALAAHRAGGFFITKGGYEYNVVLGAAAAMFAFTGPGDISFDHALGFELSGFVWGTLATFFGIIAGCSVLAGRGRIADAEDAEPMGAEPMGERTVVTAEREPTAEVAGGVEATFDRTEARTEARSEADADLS